MEQKFNLIINKPCSEKFNQFRQTSMGGFCSSCQKNVVDFRQMDDSQFVRYFKDETGNTCGYFNTSQLSRTIKISEYKQPSKFNFLRVAALAFFSLTSLHNIQAQEQKTRTEIIETSKKNDSVHNENSQEQLTTGIIMDETKNPLPGVNIVLKGTSIGTQSNFDGKFEFPKVLKERDVLVISYIGFTTQEIKIKKPQALLNVKLNIVMEEDISCFLMGEVEVNAVYQSKPTLWQRVKNIF